MPKSGYRQLVCEMLLLTHHDLQRRGRTGGINFQRRQDALAFVESAWFEQLCGMVDLEPERVRKSLMRAACGESRKSG